MSRHPPNPSDVPDEDIVRLLRIGDPEGLKQMLVKHGGKVRSNLKRELGSLFPEADLEAALNQAAYTTWNKAKTYDEKKGKLSTWLYVIARNEALAAGRRDTLRYRFGMVEGSEDFDPMESDGATPIGSSQDAMSAASGGSVDPSSGGRSAGDDSDGDGDTDSDSDTDGGTDVDAADGGERQARYIECLRESIQSLSPMQRQVIVADLQNGDVADAAELAKILNTTTNSIYVSRANGRKKLKKAMQDKGYFGSASDEQERRA